MFPKVLLTVAATIGCFSSAMAQPQIPAKSEPPIPAAISSAPTRPFGSGNFGLWQSDSWNLPVYQYTLDERSDPRALEPRSTGPTIDNTTARWQIGNDRIVANAVNHGFVKLWSQDRIEQWMNEFEPSANQFSGGFGYLTVDGESASTLAMDRPAGEDAGRRFGIGYFRHATTVRGVTADEHVFAPYGDLSLLCHEIIFTNSTAKAVSGTWWEYWGVNPSAFTFPKLADPSVSYSKRIHPVKVRRALGPCQYDAQHRILCVEQAPFEDDHSPLALFAAAVEAPVDGYETTVEEFFGKGSRSHPAALEKLTPSNRLGGAMGTEEPSRMLFAFRSPFSLKPGQSLKFRYVYGYGHQPQIVSMVESAEKRGELSLDRTMREWKAWLPNADFGPTYDWLARELKWSAYFVRSSSVYEEAMGHHVITQGNNYQYSVGWQAAFRDPLQHMLPLIYSAPALAREVLLYSAKEQSSFDGAVPYGRISMGRPLDYGIACDMDCWLLLAAAEYVMATRDFGFLDQNVEWSDGGRATFWEHLCMAYKHQESFATGMHELYVAGRSGDWSDNIPEHVGLTETTMVAAQLAYIYPRFQSLAEARHDEQWAKRIALRTAELKRLMQKEWVDVGWYSRGYAANRKVGTGVLMEEPQPWAILGQIPTREQSTRLIANMRRLLAGVDAPAFLHGPSKIGSSICPAANDPLVTEQAGTGVIGDNNAAFCGGTWYAINGTLIWALASLDGQVPRAREYAWDELLRNTLAYFAEAYPDHWNGTISSDDYRWSWYTAEPWRAKGGPYTTCNTHPPAWLWFDLIKLAGIEPTLEGYSISPHFEPASVSLNLPNIGIHYQANSMEGYFRLETTSAFHVRCKTEGLSPAANPSLTVNGKSSSFQWIGNELEFEIPQGSALSARSWRVKWH